MKVEDKVAQNDNKYRSLAPNSFADTVWVLDIKSLVILYISPETFKLRGFTSEETIGKHINEIVTPSSSEKITQTLSVAIRDFHEKADKTYTFEVETFHKDGSTIWVELKTKIIKEENDGSGDLKFVGVSRNITAQKKAENDREQLIKKLNNTIEEKNRLVEEIKIFESLLPICSACRRIRHSDKTWWPLEKYVEDKAGSQFTHTICPDCTSIYYNKE